MRIGKIKIGFLSFLIKNQSFGKFNFTLMSCPIASFENIHLFLDIFIKTIGSTFAPKSKSSFSIFEFHFICEIQ